MSICLSPGLVSDPSLPPSLPPYPSRLSAHGRHEGMGMREIGSTILHVVEPEAALLTVVHPEELILREGRQGGREGGREGGRDGCPP